MSAVRPVVAAAVAALLVASAMAATTGARAGSATASTSRRDAHHRSPASHWPLSFLHVSSARGPADLPQIVDAGGRSVFMRGVNVNGLEDYWNLGSHPLRRPYPISAAAYAHGRCPARNPAVESMTICRFDFSQLRSFGYDVVRLGVSWSLLEPRPGHISRSYVARIAQVVRWARHAGIYVVIDMHQDAWSKFLYTPPGGRCPAPLSPVTGWHEADGAPGWASEHATPACQLEKREFDPAVIEDFERFWLDTPAPDGIGLQEHFARVVAWLARRFRNDPDVAGYDLFNEPSPGTEPPTLFDMATLFPFYAKVISTVRHSVPSFRQLFFVEPDITRDITDVSGMLVPWSTYSGYRNVVYEPHVYTRVFTADAAVGGALGTSPFLPMDEGYRSAVLEGRAMGLPVWVGEFGNDVVNDRTQLAGHYASQDALGLGSALWVWKAAVDRKRGVAPEAFSVMHAPFGRGTPFPSRVVYTARAYPVYLAGTLSHLSYDAPRAKFDLVATARRVSPGQRDRATVVFIPHRSAGRIRVTGARVRVVRCATNRIAWVYPRGERYRIRVG